MTIQSLQFAEISVSDANDLPAIAKDALFGENRRKRQINNDNSIDTTTTGMTSQIIVNNEAEGTNTCKEIPKTLIVCCIIFLVQSICIAMKEKIKGLVHK